MQRHVPLTTDETYHIYNRGAHKHSVFTSTDDYNRFLMLLFLCNSEKPIVMREILAKYKGRFSVKLFEQESKNDDRLVSVYAYCLMPNHFHIVLRQEKKDGISIFMKKLCVGYSMYFNTKYTHSGVLFQGRFKSIHVDNEPYFRYIFSYVHLNPVELVEKKWEEKGISNKARVRKFLNNYRYSSFFDYVVGKRSERTILSYNDAPDFLTQQNDLEEMLDVYSEYDE